MKKIISLLLAVSILGLCASPISLAAENSLQVLISENEELKKAIEYTKDLGVEIFDISELDLDSEQLKNVRHFDTADEFLNYISESQYVELSMEPSAENVDITYALTYNISPYGITTRTLNKYSPILQENIVISYDEFYSYGHKFINDVNILSSFYSGITIGIISYTHLYGYFEGKTIIYPESMGTGGGTAISVASVTEGVDIAGVPVGVTHQVTFKIEFWA